MYTSFLRLRVMGAGLMRRRLHGKCSLSHKRRPTDNIRNFSSLMIWETDGRV